MKLLLLLLPFLCSCHSNESEIINAKVVYIDSIVRIIDQETFSKTLASKAYNLTEKDYSQISFFPAKDSLLLAQYVSYKESHRISRYYWKKDWLMKVIFQKIENSNVIDLGSFYYEPNKLLYSTFKKGNTPYSPKGIWKDADFYLGGYRLRNKN